MYFEKGFCGKGKKLINSLLQINPKKRISLEKAMEHEFFNDVREVEGSFLGEEGIQEKKQCGCAMQA